MRTIAAIMVSGACLAAVLTSAACTDPARDGTGTPTNDPPTQSTPGAPAAEPSTQEQPAPDEEWAMPDLVGHSLQAAQDQIQATTGDSVFFTKSHDLTGANRNQVLDANWTVCTQNIAPGAPLTDTAQIDFGVVKLEEACP